MAGFTTNIVKSIVDGYNFMFDEFAHPLTKNWFLVGRPYQIVSILAVYLVITTRLGPWCMSNKKPYNLRTVIKYYNILQMIVCFYLFYQGSMYIFSKEFSFLCQNLDDPKTARAYNIATSAWYYYMLKLVDLLETVFFVLRKSYRQISTLHLHHHTLMPLVSWIGMTYFPGGQAAILATLNSLVHVVMYVYYYLSGLGEEYKKSLWWKRHVTELQLVQFMIISLHAFNSLFYDCGYPTWIKVGMIIYGGIFLNMFGQFYYNCFVVDKHQNNGDVKDKLHKESHKKGPEQNGKSKLNGDAMKNIHKNGDDKQAKITNGRENHLKIH